MSNKQKQLKITELNKSKLDGTSILYAIKNLQHQIEISFPDRGLRYTIGELKDEAKTAIILSQKKNNPKVSAWSVTIGAPILLFVLIIYFAIESLEFGGDAFNGMDDVDGLVNIVFLSVMFGILIRQYFKITRRTSTMKQLHRIRSLVHVLDMKQQNKKYHNKCKTNKRPLSPEENIIYLDDCSQALSLSGKIAALMIEGHNDSLVIAAVSEIDSLCNGISSKIWQKIAVLQTHVNEKQ